MLLIDEIDRADEEFEAFLLEVLSDFQITIPELGTIEARRKPVVLLTSNRTRELHDALKRRALYPLDRAPGARARGGDRAPARAGGPGAARRTRPLPSSRSCARSTSRSRPGVAETIDWADALAALGRQELDAEVVEQTLGAVLKNREDLDAVGDEELAGLVERARAAAAG